VVCVGSRPRVDVTAFGRLAGAGVTVTSTAPPGEPEDPAGLVAVLSAEMSLLQARLDDMQSRLERITGSS
jgi:hypothetical protein